MGNSASNVWVEFKRGFPGELYRSVEFVGLGTLLVMLFWTDTSASARIAGVVAIVLFYIVVGGAVRTLLTRRERARR